MRRRQLFLVALPSLFLFFFFLFFFFILFYVHVKSTLIAKSKNAITICETPLQHKQFSLLIGILTRPDIYDRRHCLRLIYGIQSSPLAHIDVKFVFCNLTKPEQRVLIALEILRFNDIIILNCFFQGWGFCCHGTLLNGLEILISLKITRMVPRINWLGNGWRWETRLRIDFPTSQPCLITGEQMGGAHMSLYQKLWLFIDWKGGINGQRCLNFSM